MTTVDVLKIELRQCRNLLSGAADMQACPRVTGGPLCGRPWCAKLVGPQCVTSEPPWGWPEQARLDVYAASRWAADIAKDAHGNHGLVKVARDLMRHAAKGAR